MKSIEINRRKRLRDDPGTGHNRWHPEVPVVLEAAPGEAVRLQTRDATDGQITPDMTVEDLARLDPKVAHPLTGPVHVEGAQPGDLLEIEFIEIEPEPFGWTRIRPGVGFLREHFDSHFLAHWHIEDGSATSPQVPGVRVPNGAFMGTSGVAPSHAQLRAWTEREADLVRRGGLAMLPDPQDAVPTTGPVAQYGLRTLPPRENGGNADIKQLTRGSKLWLPVNVDGALFSTGDAHFAQGDSECCITAIEMGATVTLRFAIHEGPRPLHGSR